MTLVITLIKPISLSICINFQYFYMQKTAKFSGAPPLTLLVHRDCVRLGRQCSPLRGGPAPRLEHIYT
jgi:hypothetical protein